MLQRGTINPHYKPLYLCRNVFACLCRMSITEDKLLFNGELIVFDIKIIPQGSETYFCNI